ncbi:MAG: restriction endonuclease subunit S [Burkholderiales bacterium]|nr:restriction endonuclease subunit S [Burkholderiales bacterium]
MTLQRYEKYKASGVEWLGDVPDHWQPISLKWVSHRYAGGTPDRSNDAYWDEGTIPWINSGAVNQELINEPSAFITEEGYRNSSAKYVPEGALVMALAGQGKTKGMVAQTAIRTTCNQSMAAIVPRESTNPRYLYWLLDSQYEHIRNMAGGEARDGLNLDILGSIPCIRVPENEQRAIADFLDRETVKMDTLMEKKRTLIGKLKEKRAALISRTVTRSLPPDAARAAGFNPHPKLKSSGIEWLGDVPGHWDVPPLYTRYSLELGKMLDESRITGKHLIPYLRNVDVQWDRINIDDLPEMDIQAHEYERYTLKQGDLLICEGGEVGRAAIFKNNGAVVGFQKALHRLRPANQNENSRFMFYTLCWASNIGVFLAEGNPNTIPHLTGERLRRYRFPCPALPEQHAIADYLDRETAKLDRMVEKVEAAIERLREYRTALITAAVTGKIDVRKMS